jgi:hypothetical protein
MRRTATLHLTQPIGRTLLLTGLILVVLLGTLETVCRIPAVTDSLPAPSIGSNYAALEIKLHVLDTLTREAPIDCIFVGSSVVHRAIDPVTIDTVYQSQTGRSIRCFNLGLGGMVPSAARLLVEYLFDTYHPGLVIYGFSPRAFTQAGRAEGLSGRDVAGLAWLQYQRGTFSVKGWLFNHSRAYSYYVALSNWIQPDFATLITDRRAQESDWQANLGQRTLPSKNHIASVQGGKRDSRYFPFFGNYHPVPAELDSFKQLLALSHPPDRQLVVLEIPVYHVLVNDYMGRDAYDRLMAQIEPATQAAGVPFWHTLDSNPVAEEDWQDPLHLNVSGAQKFSSWLGAQIGQAVAQGSLRDPAR